MIKYFTKVLISLLSIFYCSCESVIDDIDQPTLVTLESPNIKVQLIDGGSSILVVWEPILLADTYVCKVDDKEEITLTDTQIKVDSKSKKISIYAKALDGHQDSPRSSLEFNFDGIDILKSREVQTALKVAKATDDHINYILTKIKTDGSFSDVIYAMDAGKSGFLKHVDYINNMSFGYVTEASQYYKSSQLYSSIVSAIDSWLKMDLDPPNWWYRDIGIPQNFVHTFVLMADELIDCDPQLRSKLYDYMMYSWDKNRNNLMGGANGSDICMLTMPIAVTDNNIEVINEVRQSIIDELRITNGEGIQKDYSFSQHIAHGKQLYLATYGKEFISGVLYFLELLKDTQYQLPAANIAIFDELFIQSVSWMWYKNSLDYNQCGRDILKYAIRTGGVANDFLAETKRLVAVNTPMKSQHEKSVLMMEGHAELLGNKMYPVHDYMIHRGEGFMITSRMTSTRTVGNESGNGAGVLNYHTGDGVNYIKVFGDEYEHISNKWSWKHLPGITVVADSYLPIPVWGNGGGGESSFASGASNGEIGVCGFIYKKDRTTAHKSWFYFKDYFVALGAGIGSTGKSHPVVTTINQTLNVGSVKVKESASGVSYWNNSVGYTILSPSPIIEYNVKGVDNYELFRLSLNHGQNPTGGKYEYVVFPNLSKEEFISKTQPFVVLSNTSKSQAILDTKTGQILCVFYERGSISLPDNRTITANKSCFIIYDGNEITKTSPNGGGVSNAVVNIK